MKDKTDEKIKIFTSNPYEYSLNNHKLKGELSEFRSINITGDYRIIFRELSKGRYELVELITIGTHSELY